MNLKDYTEHDLRRLAFLSMNLHRGPHRMKVSIHRDPKREILPTPDTYHWVVAFIPEKYGTFGPDNSYTLNAANLVDDNPEFDEFIRGIIDSEMSSQ